MGLPSINRKILTGAFFCTLLLLSIACISFYNSEKFKETNERLNHAHEVLFALESILVHCIDAETGERGFIITGNESYLDPYTNAIAEIAEELDKVRDLTKDNPRHQKRIRAISEQITHLAGFLSACIEARKTAGFEKAREMVITGTAKTTLDRIRKDINDAKETEASLLALRRRNSEKDARDLTIISFALTISIVIVLGIVYVIILANFRSLKKAQAEVMNKNLILEGTGDLIREMQGNKRVAELAQVIITFLANFTNAQTGALYIEEDNQLKMMSAYGMAPGAAYPVTNPGEGLAWLAALKKTTILCNDIPEGHFRLNSSFGEVIPENIIAFPFIIEGQVAGVIELGSIYNFTSGQQQFLSIIADRIAVAVTSSLAREKTKELLEETQRQAEELEAQQSALKDSNDELLAKSELLETSEAKLRAQQEELQQTNEALEKKANSLEEQKEMLKLAKAALEEKANELELAGKYKSEFLANMSHELRTPLNSILILSQLLSQNKNNLLGEKEQKYAQSIFTSGSDLLNLINEILDLSKVEAGKMEMEIEPVDIKEVVEDMRTTFSEIANNKAVDLKIAVPVENTEQAIQTDKQRLEQVLRNFLSNAFKFTPPGGKVTLTIERMPFYRQEGAAAGNQAMAFSVADTGPGIPDNKQDLVFEAFRQADGSTRRKYGGTGLGLSISRQLAQALGGEIRLHSEEGKGSIFTLILPLKYDPATSEPKNDLLPGNTTGADNTLPPAKEEPDPSQLNAIDDRFIIKENDKVTLIIEDDKQFAQILLALSRKKNYKGVIAYQGNAGLSLARHYRPLLIFLEMHVPEVDGVEVLKKLKSEAGLRHIPVQLFSATENGKAGMEAGAFDFMKKPVAATDLDAAFDRLEAFTRKKLKKLLVVEDNREQNNSIKELIGNGDVKSFSAYDGAEAWKMLTEETFDCIIVDLVLPDMTGLDLIKKIRANEGSAKVPVIVYTAKDLNKEEITQLNKLANTVILKTANSMERLLDETVLLLHRMESNLPKEKQEMIRALHQTDKVLKNRKALIVDDDMRNIYSLMNALEEAGMICLNASTGKEALASLEEQVDIDIVLMDLMMPEMDGFETIQLIRKKEQYAKLPVVAVTAKAMKGDREKCLEAGFSDYIAKPINIEQLSAIIRIWVS